MSSVFKHGSIARRRFIAGSAAAATISLTDWLSTQSLAAAARPPRSDVGTAPGKAMLLLYKKAVAEMKNTSKWPLYHPHNWQFQANIHSYPPDMNPGMIFDPAQGTTSDEKAKIAAFKAMALGSPGRPKVWKTCSHFTSVTHFLTWHRMYLYFFERIVEKVVGVPFAMPYWTYAADEHRKIKLPLEFIKPMDGTAENHLFFAARTQAFLTGDGLRSPSEASHKQAFSESTLLRTPSRNGFSDMLEFTPHGSIHAAVGTTDGMGAFEMAARDPIFWPHHANIDRLWESWRRADADGKSPRDNVSSSPAKPDWKSFTKFAFAGPNAERIEMTVGDAILAGTKLGVKYDKLEVIPVAMAFAAENNGPTTTLSQSAAGTATITTMDDAVTAKLEPAAEPPVAMGFAGRATTRYQLHVEAEADQIPGGAFEVYVNIPEVTGSDQKVAHYLGTFNFFSGSGHGDGLHKPVAKFNADITDLVSRGLIDPRLPGEVTFRARYVKPKVPVTIKSTRIEAR